MKKPVAGENWYFVDETGDPIFYDHRGNLIVGQEGCSPILALGFIETTDPASIRRALADLHSQIASDSYLQAIPSIWKTNRAFHAKEGAFYDHLVSRLFENVLHRHTHNRIYFAQRGSRTRQAQLEQAIHRGVGQFESRWATKVETTIRVEPQTAVGEPCLQVIDYLNWAVHRAFVKREMRYYRFVEDRVSLLVDLYDVSKYPKNWYNRENPFDIEKASPL